MEQPVVQILVIDHLPEVTHQQVDKHPLIHSRLRLEEARREASEEEEVRVAEEPRVATQPLQPEHIRTTIEAVMCRSPFLLVPLQ